MGRRSNGHPVVTWGRKRLLAATGVQGLRDEYTRSLEPARALADKTLKLERKLKAEG